MFYCTISEEQNLGLFIGVVFLGLLIALIVVVAVKLSVSKNRRFSQFVPFSGDYAYMTANIEYYLSVQGFLPDQYKDETGVFRNGNGFSSARKYIKIAIVQGGYQIEAFTASFGLESDLKGNFAGIIPKKVCRDVVYEIINMIQYGVQSPYN